MLRNTSMKQSWRKETHRSWSSSSSWWRLRARDIRVFQLHLDLTKAHPEEVGGRQKSQTTLPRQEVRAPLESQISIVQTVRHPREPTISLRIRWRLNQLLMMQKTGQIWASARLMEKVMILLLSRLLQTSRKNLTRSKSMTRLFSAQMGCHSLLKRSTKIVQMWRKDCSDCATHAKSKWSDTILSRTSCLATITNPKWSYQLAWLRSQLWHSSRWMKLPR